MLSIEIGDDYCGTVVSVVYAMLKAYPIQGFVRASATFRQPILDFDTAARRFLKCLFHALATDLVVRPSDLFVIGGSNLGEVRAGLRILGSNSTIILWADRVELEFPTIGSPSSPMTQGASSFVDQIIAKAYTAFTGEFSETQFAIVNAAAGSHYEISERTTIDRLTGENAPPKFIQKLGADINANVWSGYRIGLAEKEGVWTCNFGVEPSVVVQGGLFMLREFQLLRVEGVPKIDYLFSLIVGLDQKFLSTLGLEVARS